MTTKTELFDRIPDKDDRIFLSSIADKLEQSDQMRYSVFSDFLDSKQMDLAAKVFQKYGENLSFHGGIHHAERRICYLSFDNEEIPIVLLRAIGKEPLKVTHRDVLGALMGLGIKHQKIGDIVVEESVIFAVKEEIADYICTSLSSIGRYPVTVRPIEGFDVEKKQEFSFRSAVVASLRMDCIVSEILHLSREKAKLFILANQVRVNHLEATNYKRLLSEGDVLSVSHKGRFVLEEVGGLTKKDRVKIRIKKYE